MEPGGPRRPAPVRRHLRRIARLDLNGPSWQLSLPTLNWLFAREDRGTALGAILAAASRHGFEAVGLDGATVARSRHRDPAAVARLLRDHGLECSDVGILVADAPDARARAGSLAALAAATGAPVCITVFEARPTAESLSELGACSVILADAGVRLALEFVPYAGVPTLGDAVAVCEAVGWERCGVLLDSWHFFRGGEPWQTLRTLSGAQLALVHVSDGGPAAGDPVHESRHERLPVGHGVFALTRLARELVALGYAGAVSAEVLSARLRALPADAAARQLIASLRTFLASSRS